MKKCGNAHRRRDALRRAGMILLAVILAVEFVPLIDGSFAYAADGGCTYEEEVVNLPAEQVRAEKKKAEAELKAELGVIDDDEIVLGANAGAQPAEPAHKGQGVIEVTPDTDLSESEVGTIAMKGSSIELRDDTDIDPTKYFAISQIDSEGIMQVEGYNISSQGGYFLGLYMGDDLGDAESLQEIAVFDASDQYSFTKTIDTKQFTVGMHTLYAFYTTDGTTISAFYAAGIPTYIYGKAENSAGNYFTGKNYFSYSYSGDNYYEGGVGEYLDIYMDYKKAGEDWSNEVFPLNDGYSEHKITGLQANTTYFVRMMYGKTVEYNGETYLFTGRQTGNASDAVKIKTAYIKPNVKSIKGSKVKTIVRKYKVHYANRYYYRVYRGYRKLIKIKPLYRTYKYYYTRYKITVKFSKKQDVAAVCIRSVQGTYAWKMGNRTTYSQTFLVNGKKKGKKVAVTVQSVRSTIYGGYSGKYKKKVKL